MRIRVPSLSGSYPGVGPGTVTAVPRVRMVYRKYDDSLHWHQWFDHLGDDEHGRWLGAPAGSTAQRGDGPPVTAGVAQVMLVGEGNWWTAIFHGFGADAGPREVDVYCDVTTPVRFETSDLVTAIDLDLDVIRYVDGTVYVDDEDEFAEHQLEYAYPPDVIASARKSCDWLTAAVTSEEPFVSAYRPYLERVIGSG